MTETAVLPGTARPAMIRDLVTRLLATPRLVGFTWFDYPSRVDWRIENDPAAAAELAAALQSPYFGSAGHVTDPVVAAPVVQNAPAITGTAHVGETLTASTGSWRSATGSGALTVSGRWYRCTDTTTTSSCAEESVPGPSYAPTQADFAAFLRSPSPRPTARGPPSRGPRPRPRCS